MTTITTVGFREVKPLSDGGRVFTVLGEETELETIRPAGNAARARQRA